MGPRGWSEDSLNTENNAIGGWTACWTNLLWMENQMWWLISLTPSLRRLAEEDQEFKVSLSGILPQKQTSQQEKSWTGKREPRKGTEEGETCRQMLQVPTCEENMFRSFIFHVRGNTKSSEKNFNSQQSSFKARKDLRAKVYMISLKNLVSRQRL